MNAAGGLDHRRQPAPRRWDAELELGFGTRDGVTRLVRRRHTGPLQVQRPFHPESSGACHVYLLHPPGGIAGGDSLQIRVAAESAARVLLTTPAATKFYRTNAEPSAQHTSIRVGADSAVEWLPQETLVFGGARGETTLSVDVEVGGAFLGWEVCCLGRPASGDAFSSGSFVQRIDLRIDGEPVAVERTRIDADASVRHARWGLAGRPVFGSLVAFSSIPDLADRVRRVLPAPSATDLFGVTARRHVLVCRYLGDSVVRAREGFVRAWAELRTALLGRPASLPRIWST